MTDISINLEDKNPKELLSEGKSAYFRQDYNCSLSALSKASDLLVAEHGSKLHESLKTDLFYGKALLSLYRGNTEALGEGVSKNNEDDDEEENDNNNNEENVDNTDAKTKEGLLEDTNNNAKESGDFQSTVNDTEECLMMEKQTLGVDSRTIAETLYKLGADYCTNAQVDEAIASFKESIKYLKDRINLLKIESRMKDIEEDEVTGHFEF